MALECAGELGQHTTHARFKAVGEMEDRKGGQLRTVMEVEAFLGLDGVGHQACGPRRLPSRDWPQGGGILSTSQPPVLCSRRVGVGVGGGFGPAFTPPPWPSS